MELTKGRPQKYFPMLEALDPGQTVRAWGGQSASYSMKLAWEINTRRIAMPEGEFRASRAKSGRGWVVWVTRTG